MTELPFVSVIVPHYNDLRGLDRCLASLATQTYPRDRFEVVVADNNSPQGEAEIASIVSGRAKLIVVSEKGAGPARNGGVVEARGEVLAFIDSDCIAEPEWLAEGVRALSEYDFLGGRVRVLVEDMQNMTGAEAFERVFAFDFKTYILRKGFSGSGNLFCPTSLFEAVGGFKTGVSEDKEWSFRATAAGFRLGYAPAAIVWHPARATWEDLKAKWRRVNAEMFGLASTQPGGRLKWLARSLAVPFSALVHTPRVLFSPELSTVRQRVPGLVVLYRLRLWRTYDSLRLLIREA